jgi:hypothetical protein
MAKNVKTKISGAPVGGGAYFITYIGAAVYFMHQAYGFWGFVYALLKAAVWPAIVLYKAMILLHVG